MKTSQIKKRLKPVGSESAIRTGDPVLKIEIRQRRLNRSLAVNDILEILKKEAPGFWKSIAQVGSWLWLQVPGPYSRREANLLWTLGFHFSAKRQCFQHPCGSMTDAVSTRDPRTTYGIQYPAMQH